ncbi:NUDIX hydrolase [Halomarina litorea]|uniref:NUDIX hydrolase n=1 Tax=Halomarina litorea TaxID=2961595 RepID=UPI0020C5A5FC|nr:NUDIX domain-containing protein [Halomarina sp. BCD28]
MSEPREDVDGEASREAPKPMLATVSQKAILFGPDGRLLVLREADGDWEFPGGRIDRGEAVMPALHRELREETGLSVTVGGPVHTAVRKRHDRGKFFVYYRCATDEADVTLSEEHVDSEWTTPERARDRLNDRCRSALERVLGREE